MLQARFEKPHSHEQYGFVSEYFESVGDSLRTASGEEIAVHHTNGTWHSQGKIYIAIQFDANVMLHFEHPELGEQVTIGPIHGLRLVDGAIWDLRKPPKLIARFEDTNQLWHIYERPAVSMPKFTVHAAKQN